VCFDRLSMTSFDRLSMTSFGKLGMTSICGGFWGLMDIIWSLIAATGLFVIHHVFVFLWYE